MMVFVLILEISILYVLSRRLTQNLYVAAFLLTKSRPISISFLSILFFPGTVIHELAHLFTAEILGVRTSGLTLIPEGIEQRDVRTGSVSIAQSDPFRRAAIGIAPVFWGLGTLGLLAYFLPTITSYVLLSGMYYLLFAVSNTMFSSKEDMEGFWPLILVLLLVTSAMYVAGIRFTLTEPVLSTVTEFFASMAAYLGYVTGLNILMFLTSRVLITGVERVTKRKLAHTS